jgi:hypothetical protein
MSMRAEQWRGVKQPIDVVLADGTSSQISPRALDVLLDTNRVLKFRRSSGWVTVGVDPVRSRRSSFAFDSYSGPERRHSAH